MRPMCRVLLGIAAPLWAQTVSGTVFNGVTHEPLSGATVMIANPRSGLLPQNVRTGSDGSFRSEVAPGDYEVIANQENFDSPPFSRVRLHVESGTDPAPLRITLMPWPNLSGRVLDRDRRPVAKVSVTAIPTHGTTPWAVTTDSDGRYSFKNLQPSRYTLLANPLEGNRKAGVAPAYYPNATDRANSQSITVAAGPDLTDLDIVLAGGPFFNVSGRVLDEHGNPVGGATVRVRNADVLFAKTTTGDDGTFTIEKVPEMRGRVSAQCRGGDADLQGYLSFALTDHDMEHVDVRVAPPVSLTGTLELDGKPVSPGNGYAVLEPVDGMAQRVEGTNLEHGFRFDDAYAGYYRLVFYPMGRSGYLDSILLGDRDITMQPFDLAPGMQSVRVILATGGGQVRGTVEDSEAQLMTVLVPRQEQLRHLPFIQQALSQGGRFQFSGVRPGDYYALTLSGLVWLVDLQDAAFLTPLLSRAAAVHVERGAAVSVKVKAP